MGNQPSRPPVPPPSQDAEERAPPRTTAQDAIPTSAPQDDAGADDRALKGLYANMRFALWPASGLCFVWTLYMSPSSLPEGLPVLWKPPSNESSADKIVPIHPKNLRQSFQFGRLSAQCFIGVCPPSALKEAANISGRDNVTSKQLLAIEALVEELDSKSSLIDTLSGVMSFINVVWFFSIVGIVATVIPVMHKLFGDIISKVALALGRMLYSCFRPILMWLANDLPKFCHEYGVFEAALYLTCLSLINTAAAYPVHQVSAARMVALTGALGFLPALFYSAKLHEPPVIYLGNSRSPKYKVDAASICCAFAALELIPLTLVFDSNLMGFFAVSFFYQMIGFGVSCFGFGFSIGFDSLKSLERCCITSKIMLITYAIFLVNGLAKKHIVRPFALGIMVWGSVVYFLALLIISGRWHCGGFGKKYNMINLLMVSSIALYSFLGFVWHAPALSNTAITFLVLWLMEKQFEVLKIGVISLFLGCLMLAWSSHQLSTRPDFLLKIIEPQGVLL